MIVISKIIIPV